MSGRELIKQNLIEIKTERKRERIIEREKEGEIEREVRQWVSGRERCNALLLIIK